MQTSTRLLLPFTEGINAQAMEYAVQLAAQHGSTLVPLALIPVKAGQGPRLELIQQAQDFLILIQRKAEHRGVPLESSQIYTREIARSIEAFASEMSCEAVILFLSNSGEVLLGQAEIQALMDNSSCNMHMVLMPEKRGRDGLRYPLHLSLFKQAGQEKPETRAEVPPSPEEQEHVSLLRRFIHSRTRER